MSTSVSPTIRNRVSLDTSPFHEYFELGGRILLANGAGPLSMDRRLAR